MSHPHDITAAIATVHADTVLTIIEFAAVTSLSITFFILTRWAISLAKLAAFMEEEQGR